MSSTSQTNSLQDDSTQKVSNTLSQLPLSDLICTPIIEACYAQDDLNSMLFNTFDSLIDDDGHLTTATFISDNGISKKSITLPIISIVEPISLGIKNVNVGFEVAIKSINNYTTSESTNKSLVSTGTWPNTEEKERYIFNGTLTTNSATSTDACFKIFISAEERKKSIGIQKLQEFLAQNIVEKDIKISNQSVATVGFNAK